MSEQDKCKPRPSPRPPKDHHKYFKTTPMPNMTNCLHLTTPQSIYSAYILTMKNINRHTDTHSSFLMKIVSLSYKTNINLNIVQSLPDCWDVNTCLEWSLSFKFQDVTIVTDVGHRTHKQLYIDALKKGQNEMKAHSDTPFTKKPWKLQFKK